MNKEVPIKKADKIGRFPANYDVPALPQRRLAAVARWAIVVATVEGFAIITLAFAIAALLPLQKVVPMVVGASEKGDQIIRLNPISIENPTADYLTEIQLKNYVTARYAIVGSNAEQEMLWGLNSTVQLMSSTEVYGKFMNEARPDWTRMRQGQQIRKVTIDSVRKLGDQIWQVEYTTFDTAETSAFNADVAPDQRQWVSTYKVSYQPKNVRYDDRLINPLGFTVDAVNDARRY